MNFDTMEAINNRCGCNDDANDVCERRPCKMSNANKTAALLYQLTIMHWYGKQQKDLNQIYQASMIILNVQYV